MYVRMATGKCFWVSDLFKIPIKISLEKLGLSLKTYQSIQQILEGLLSSRHHSGSGIHKFPAAHIYVEGKLQFWVVTIRATDF